MLHRLYDGVAYGLAERGGRVVDQQLHLPRGESAVPANERASKRVSILDNTDADIVSVNGPSSHCWQVDVSL